MGVKGYAIHLSFSTGKLYLWHTRHFHIQSVRCGEAAPFPFQKPRHVQFVERSLYGGAAFIQKNKWQDDEGRIYIIYPIAEIAEILVRGRFSDHHKVGFLTISRTVFRLYEGRISGHQLVGKLYLWHSRHFDIKPVRCGEAAPFPFQQPRRVQFIKRPLDGQKTDLMMVGKPSPNQTTINNLTESQTKGVSGGPSAPYGRYGNIFLSQTEYDELQAEYPDRLERFIEEMSRYLAANGKSYQNYAAALRIWAGNDKKGAPKKGIPDYSCKEGESL